MTVQQAALKPNARTFAALIYPQFRWYMVGQLISISGSWTQRVALGWLVFQLTQSEFWLGLIAFATGLPVLFLSPWAGVLADRFPRRHILMITYMVEMGLAFILALLASQDAITVWILLGMGLISGFATAFAEPARFAFIQDLVGRDHLNSALGLNAVMFNSATVLGPIVAGVLLTSVGVVGCFLINGSSFIVVLMVLASLSLTHIVKSSTNGAPYRQLIEGLNFARRHATIAPTLLLQVLMNVFGIAMMMTLLPALAATTFNSPTVGYSLLAAMQGLGSIIGSFLNTWLGSRVRRGWYISTISLFLPVGLIALNLSPSLFVAAICIALLGVGYTTFFITANVLLQTQSPDGMRGRVISLWATTRFGLAPLFALILGGIAEGIGVAPMMILVSLAVIPMVGWLRFRHPALRELA